MLNIKHDFPIFSKYPNLVYLDNAATSQKPAAMIERLQQYYRSENANVHRGIYDLSEQATTHYETARARVAEHFGAQANNIVFTSGLTDSINKFSHSLKDLLFFGDQSEGILLTEMEHHSNIVAWQRLATDTNASFDFIKVTDDFRLNKKDLHAKVKGKNIKILALTHMSNTLGTINDLEEIIFFMRKNSAQTIIILDMAQSSPHQRYNLASLDVDIAFISAHKLYGPMGLGVVYAKKFILDNIYPLAVGGGMISKVERLTSTWQDGPQRHEAGTPNVAGAIAFQASLDYLEKIGWTNITNHEFELTEYFLNSLHKYCDKNSKLGLKLIGPKTADRRGPVFSMLIDGIHAHDVAQILSEEDIAVRAGHHCNQILLRDVYQTSSTFRVSLALYNVKSDIDKFFAAMDKVAATFNK